MINATADVLVETERSQRRTERSSELRCLLNNREPAQPELITGDDKFDQDGSHVSLCHDTAANGMTPGTAERSGA